MGRRAPRTGWALMRVCRAEVTVKEAKVPGVGRLVQGFAVG